MSKIPEPLTREVFECSLQTFLREEVQEILEGVNERSNCGRWAIYLQAEAHKRGLDGYTADTEYNRKQGGRVKTILDGKNRVVRINCDLILHSRGTDVAADNLIAIELKKYDRPEKEKRSDRMRLRLLTKESFDGFWINDGTNPPEHVCGYQLGVFIELDRRRRLCQVEFFTMGQFESRRLHEF